MKHNVVYLNDGDFMIVPEWLADTFKNRNDCEQIEDYETGEILYQNRFDALEYQRDR